MRQHCWPLTGILVVLISAMAVVAVVWLSSERADFPDEERLSDGRVILSKERYKQLVVQAALCSDNATLFQSAYERLREQFTLKVACTAYNATVAQCGKADGITASGSRARQGRTLAVSRDLAFLMGTRVRVVGPRQDHGIFVVEDLMSRRFERRVDIYMDTEDDAEDFGHHQVTLIPI